MIRYLVLGVTFLSLFWLPWPFTVFLMFLASVFVPLAGIVFGVLLEVLYAPVGFIGVPIGVLWGALASLAGFGLSRFIATRIMSS